jgi:hypothetical protein
MTTYRNIHGRSIQAVTTDPSESVAEGQVWYNTTSDTFKSVVSTSAWSSGSPLTTGRNRAMGAGTTTAAVTAGGYAGSPTSSNLTEEYNGSGWSAANNMATGSRGAMSAGTQTAAITAGGLTAPYPAGGTNVVSQTYDGTNWTNTPSPNTINTGRANIFIGTAGVQTSALLVGGEGPNIPGISNAVESYNGTSWSNETNYPNPTYQGGIAGASEVVITAGGQGSGGSPAPTRSESYNYDGSSWTANPNLNTTRDYMAGFGIQTSALICGGSLPPGGPANYANVEEWDGTTWTEIADLSSARRLMGSAGTAPSGMVFGGDPGTLTLTEEFNKSANVITAAAWASGGNLNTGRNGAGGAGPQTAAMAYGGQQNPGTASKAETEQYDGTSWTEVSDLNTARYTGAPSVQGTQTATLLAGGQRQAPDVSAYNNTETWDGSSWSEVNNLNTGRDQIAGSGTSTAALAFGGNTPPTTAKTESWNGTSWSEVNDLNSADRLYVGTGSQTAALAVGGKTSPNAKTEEWDGTNWTAGGSLISGRASGGIAGSQTSTIYFGGDTPSTYPTATEAYDGTSWSTRPSLASGRQRLTAGSGSSTAALGSGGYSNTTASVTATEEFTGETTALNVKTLTQS